MSITNLIRRYTVAKCVAKAAHWNSLRWRIVRSRNRLRSQWTVTIQRIPVARLCFLRLERRFRNTFHTDANHLSSGQDSIKSRLGLCTCVTPKRSNYRNNFQLRHKNTFSSSMPRSLRFSSPHFYEKSRATSCCLRCDYSTIKRIRIYLRWYQFSWATVAGFLHADIIFTSRNEKAYPGIVFIGKIF